MSPEYQGEPVPSMMWPLVITTSKDNGADACGQSADTHNRVRTEIRALSEEVMSSAPFFAGS
jgi:hypothetical protein